MKLDKKATRYEYGNGRFDLMTSEQVRTLTHDDLLLILSRLTDAMRQGESSMMEELYHQLVELHLRYPESDFRLEILPVQETSLHE